MNPYWRLERAWRRLLLALLFFPALVFLCVGVILSPLTWVITGKNADEQLEWAEDTWDSLVGWTEGKPWT